MKNKPKLTKTILKEVYSRFPNYLFFTTVKTGVRNCHCTACNEQFVCGINTLKRTETPEWRVADSAKHRDVIRCPVCGASVTVINTKLQDRLKEPRITITQPTAFFYGLSENDVWVCCYFIERKYSYDGKHCFDTQFETNVYHLTPTGANYYKRHWSPYFGWHDELNEEYLFREPFQWDSGLSHRKFENYSFIYATERKLNDTFLKYSGFDEYQKKYPNAPMLQYWCWYSEHPQLEMLSKFGHFSTIEEMIYRDADIPTYLNWQAKKPWELYRLTKSEYNIYQQIFDGYRIRALKLYKALKVNDIVTLGLCGKMAGTLHTGIKPLLNYGYKIREQKDNINSRLQQFLMLSKLCYGNFRETDLLERRIIKYGKTVKEAVKYFERISRNSAGCCHQCPGITVREVVSMWTDYINMGDKGAKNFNPYPSDLKGAHDNLLELKRQRSAASQRKHAVELGRKLARKYKNANKNCRALKEKYYYDNGTYVFVTPNSISDVMYDGLVLNQCTARPDAFGENWRYLERIDKKETYIGFVRKSGEENLPWFTIEFEPCGTVRQKRATHDSQPEVETKLVTRFLVEWQEAVASRLDNSDFNDARDAKIKRISEFEELRRTKKTINYGELAGTLLIEAFEKDLMEIEVEIA